MLECRDMTIIYKNSNIEEQEIKIANKIIEEQRELNKVENITEEAETIVEEMHDIEIKELKEEMRLMEGIKETQEEDLEILNINKQNINAQEIEEKEMITEGIELLLSKSIWASSKDRCEGRGIIRAKVAVIKVLGNNAKHRERSLKWSIGRNVHVKEISEKFEQGNL